MTNVVVGRACVAVWLGCFTAAAERLAEARTQDVTTDRAALVALYNATDGPNWFKQRNWLSDKPLDQWNGVTVRNGRVTELFLHFNQLMGPVPSELGNLTGLRKLDLSSNRLVGPLPPELGKLINLQRLDLGYNRLTGSIPPELGELADLRDLELIRNQLTGPLPPALGKLSNLQWLNLSLNRLTGLLPAELGNLVKLEKLDLFHNQLTGPLPPELGNLAKLEHLHLIGNQVTGPIPSELGNLANLQVLVLGFNRLTGVIPLELSRLGNLQRLYLVENQLTGPIPPELGNLANLQELSLAQNQLTGQIPPELGRLANLQKLALSNNSLAGQIPPELGNLANLQELSLVNNQLTGQIPPELGNLANLETLALMGKHLTGRIPPELGKLIHLRELFLSGNPLTGPIPPELGKLANLEKLWLNSNELTGAIPRELGNLANLRHFLSSRNQLTGSIPSELGNLTKLELLQVGENQLTGPIPSKLGDLGNLRVLYFYDNQLTGPIPTELGNLGDLERLTLRENHLTGPIPSELADLSKLTTLDLSENQLTGPIPTELGDLGDLQYLYLGFNQLTGPIPSELANLAKLETLSLSFNQLTGTIPRAFINLVALKRFWFLMNSGLCAREHAVIRNWLDGMEIVVGPDCYPSITLSVTPSNLVEGRATSVMVTATQTAVSNRTSVSLLFGGTATTPGDGQDYTLSGFQGSFNALLGTLTIPANRASGTGVLTFFPLADGLIEGQEDVILQSFVGGMLPDLRGARVEGSAFLSLNDRIGCVPRDRAALVALYHATGGTNWIRSANWLSEKPLSDWHGVTVDNNGCVTHLDLSNNRLTGILPLQLGYLIHLEELVLGGNQLTGIIPPSFTSLVALKRFRYHLNSGLCTQGDTSVRTWLDGVADVRGPDCSSLGTTSSIFVPVLLNSAGRNASLFTSELTLTNRSVTEATLQYTYRARDEPEKRSGKASDVLDAGRQRINTDALDYLRNLGIPIPETGNQLGTLRVDVPLGLDVEAVVRTTTLVPEGRAGLAYLGIPEEGGFREPVYLCGLRQNFQDRSNVAFQHMGSLEEGAITLKTTVYSGEAGDIEARELEDVRLEPGGFHQYSGLLGELGSPAQGYVKVERVEGSAPFYAYGVINDQANSDGSFVFPVTARSLEGTTGQTLPVIVETRDFTSELTVTNFSEEPRTLDFQFVADRIQTGDKTAGFSMTLEAGQQRIVPELVEELRRQGVAGLGTRRGFYAGPLFVEAEEGDLSGVVIGARTGSEGGGGSYSVFYDAVPNGEGFNREAWVYGLQQNGENRSNLALVNTGEVDESASVFHVEIYDGESGMLAETVVTKPIPARGWHQIDGILIRASADTRQGYVRIEKMSGKNPFLAYGVVNDGGAPGERSGDGAYLPARE